MPYTEPTFTEKFVEFLEEVGSNFKIALLVFLVVFYLTHLLARLKRSNG